VDAVASAAQRRRGGSTSAGSMSTTPTRRDLALEIAERNERCGDVQDESICLLARGHKTVHRYEEMTTTIPIE
jgi:hypothetical protein